MTPTLTATAPQIENPIELAEASLRSQNELVADVVGFVAGDYINLAAKTFDVVADAPHIFSDVGQAFCTGIALLGKKFKGDEKGASQELAKLSTYQSSCMKVGAVVAAAAFVGLRFVNFGKLAKAATEKMGNALGHAAGKKVFTEAVAEKLAVGAMDAVEKAVTKDPSLTIEVINEIKCKTVAKMMEEEVASTVSKDLLPVLKTLGKKGLLTKNHIVTALVEAGIVQEEASDVAKLLMKARISKHMGNKRSLAKMEEILVTSITSGMKAEYEVQKGAFGAAFAKKWGELADDMVARNKISGDMAKKMKETALDGFDDAVREGIEKGVKRGVHEAFDAYRKWKFRVRLHFSEGPQHGVGPGPRTRNMGTTRSAYQRIIAGWNFKNFEDQWKDKPFEWAQHTPRRGLDSVPAVDIKTSSPKLVESAGKPSLARRSESVSGGLKEGESPKLELQAGGASSVVTEKKEAGQKVA